jgi:hypothetical protein
VLELIVTDADDNPVRDLTVEQLRVSERVEQSEELPQKISDFRAVNKPVEGTSPQTEGMVLSAPHRASFCGSDGSYEISYTIFPRQPGGMACTAYSSRVPAIN